MKTVLNSVRMIAPVGHASTQLACLQCLQTSDIISPAAPLPVVADSSGTSSMNFTWRQFWASSEPVLSKLSARKLGLSPWSWFRSLHATSQALHPMHTLVSVKKPYSWPAWMAAISETHQVGGDLGKTLLAREEVEGDGGHLVDEWHRRRIDRQVDAQEVSPAGLAGFDPHVRKERAVLGGDAAARQASHHAAALAGGRAVLAEDAQPGAGVLSAGRARDSRIAPRRGAARAHEVSRTGRQ